jgi:O-antigen/teichoic acid export membrane protein
VAESLKNKTVKGVIWSSIERFSVQSITFFVLIFMARLLNPSDYGLVGMLSVFISVSQAIIDSGFSEALIRKQNRTEVDCSTVFYFNIVISGALYALLCLCAPLIADFYNEPQLTILMRVIGLNLILNSFCLVQRALLTTHLNFKLLAKVSLSAAIISGIVGIAMAYYGLGVWAIVGQQLSSVMVNTVLLWLFSKWSPKLIYSWKSFREMFSFGSKLLASGLLDSLYNNMYSLVIGKVFSASDLGYYSRAKQFAAFPSSNLTGIMQRVTYPVLCTITDDDERLGVIYRRFLRVSAFIVFPLMMILAAVAEPLILTLIKEKWLFAATLLQIICFSMMWYPIHAINLNLLKVKGRSDLFLRLEIIKKILGVTILCIAIPMGLIALCISAFFSSMIGLFINTYYTGKLINVGYVRQMRDLMPTFFLSVASGGIVYFTINTVDLAPLLQLILGGIEGVIVYILGAMLFRFSEFKELINIINVKRK